MIGLPSHLMRIISTYVDNLKKSEVSLRRRFVFLQGETVQTPQSITGCIKSYFIMFLVVGNNKTIHAPTSRNCYFHSLKCFKIIVCPYHLLIIYASHQQFYLHCSYHNFLFKLITSFKI